jgi:glycosyltransferase involved in cell wall biosynthesis
VLGEAMAAGVPCVATDVGDARHVVGETGEIAPPGDADALARAMERLLDRLTRSPGTVRAAARDRIVACFSLDRMIDRSESALAQLLGVRAAPVAADRISTIGN